MAPHLSVFQPHGSAQIMWDLIKDEATTKKDPKGNDIARDRFKTWETDNRDSEGDIGYSATQYKGLFVRADKAALIKGELEIKVVWTQGLNPSVADQIIVLCRFSEQLLTHLPHNFTTLMLYPK